MCLPFPSPCTPERPASCLRPASWSARAHCESLHDYMRIIQKKLLAPVITLTALAGLPGCRSAYVQTAIVNHTGTTVHVVEVDYPSASFGTQQIASNQTFNYRFKVQGSGPIQISYAGDHGDSHTAS